MEENKLFEAHGYTVKWYEQTPEGYTILGFADEITRAVKHKGWYTSDENINGELYRGIVYASLDGERYLFGYADPNNPGASLLSVATFSDEVQAALKADAIAQRFAESERDYGRAWQAGRRVEDITTEVAESAARIERLRNELTIVHVGTETYRTLQEKTGELILDCELLAKERQILIDTFGKHPGFTE